MTSLQRVKISALGTYVPPRLLTNADLEKMVETSNDWIMSRVGIKERHIAEKGVGTSDLAAEAARRALAQRGIEASELDAIIVATVTPDMMFPATACLVQDKIGAQNVWGFDLQAGCSQFVYALQVGAQFVQTGAHKKVMVIGADVMSSIIDYTDRATCVLFGDGAGAVILEPVSEEDGRRRPHRLHARSRRRGRVLALHACGRKPQSSVARDRRQEDALRSSGRGGGLQIRGAQNV